MMITITKKDIDSAIDLIDEEKIVDYEYYPGEFKEDIQKIEHALKNIDEEFIDKENIEKKFKKINSLLKEEDYKESVQMTHDLLIEIDILDDLTFILSHIDDILDSYRENKSEIPAKLIQKRDKIQRLCTERKYKKALSEAKTLEKDIEDTDPHILDELWETKIRKVRKKLRIARFSGFGLSKTKELAKKGVESKKQGEIKKALEIIDLASDLLDELFLFSQKFDDSKKDLENILKEDLEKKEEIWALRLEDIYDLLDEGEFKKAETLLNGFPSLKRKKNN